LIHKFYIYYDHLPVFFGDAGEIAAIGNKIKNETFYNFLCLMYITMGNLDSYNCLTGLENQKLCI